MARKERRTERPEPPKKEKSQETPAGLRVGELYAGIFQGGSRRGGFVVLETPGLGDVFVPLGESGEALHGDQVRVEILRVRAGQTAEGRVERVLRHANKQIVGQLRRAGRFCVVTPKNSKINRQVELHRRHSLEEVPEKSWVIVEVTSWSDSPETPLVGKLVEVLGTEGDKRLPILLLIREGGIIPEFPAEVEAEAQEWRKRPVGEAEIKRRRDLRSERICTIDPATAKDFDDAVSLHGRPDGGWRIGVHIADVAHYVRPGSAIDAEAYDRATSIYPVDRVIPMLPEALSNELCSLRPGEDKLVMTAFFTVTKQGEVRDVELCEAIMHSIRRFAYEEVQGLMDDADGVENSPHPKPSIPDALREDLMEIREASKALLAARMRRGSLDLDLPETEVVFDADGIVENVRRKDRLESHRLIEDLMIAANEAVASELARQGFPLLYRVHDPPSSDKLVQLAPVLGRFGINFKRGSVPSQAELQTAILKAKQHPAGSIVQRLVLRSLPRAHYQPENIGHFGLASRCYTHFTSPIRRYPDLIAHRAVKALLAGGAVKEAYIQETAGRIGEWGRHTSAREERSQKIEWDAQKILTLEYMKRHMGDVFEGYISGVVSRGFFVELVEYPAEGFVPIRTIEGDYFDFDKDTMSFYGRRTSRTFTVGDAAMVQIQRIDVLSGEMDLQLIRKETRSGKGKSHSAPPRKGKTKKGYDWRKHARRK